MVARISRHVLRLEREYRLAEKFNHDGSNTHFVRPIELLSMAPRRHGDERLIAMIVESPGKNYLAELVREGELHGCGQTLTSHRRLNSDQTSTDLSHRH